MEILTALSPTAHGQAEEGETQPPASLDLRKAWEMGS